jgi:hypothetical protein
MKNGTADASHHDVPSRMVQRALHGTLAVETLSTANFSTATTTTPSSFEAFSWELFKPVANQFIKRLRNVDFKGFTQATRCRIASPLAVEMPSVLANF